MFDQSPSHDQAARSAIMHFDWRSELKREEPTHPMKPSYRFTKAHFSTVLAPFTCRIGDPTAAWNIRVPMLEQNAGAKLIPIGKAEGPP
jgi:hypothetical protein